MVYTSKAMAISKERDNLSYIISKTQFLQHNINAKKCSERESMKLCDKCSTEEEMNLHVNATRTLPVTVAKWSSRILRNIFIKDIYVQETSFA